MENTKTAFKFLSDKVYDHTSGEAEKEPCLWQALGEQDFRLTSSMIFSIVRTRNGRPWRFGLLNRLWSWSGCRQKSLVGAGSIAGVPP